MSEKIDRRTFVKGSLLASATAAALGTASGKAGAAEAKNVPPADKPAAKDLIPKGKIGDLEISRLLLGGNLLTHYTHSRDLKYVYKLAALYNTDEKILETLATAEENGVDTLVIHTVPRALSVLKKHRQRGGKMKWIICTTANIDDKLEAYTKSVRQLVDDGTDAIYLWGVRADQLAAKGRMDLIARTVEIAKDLGVPSGVGAHDLNVIKKCEESKIDNDFYIKTLHHHQYPSAPRSDELRGAYAENPGYWCNDPKAVVDFMKGVKKPWIAFKVMAAGAIPPANAFKYAIQSGADFVLAGMFDFEIKDDAQTLKGLLAKNLPRERPWLA
ncbi:MAG: hypothetical protein QGI24_05740 [Kiritimatiellia bacterium]|jgi:hypothetical protein|nr:hypothetical protein [Kiritimatiellia bacterium]MDP6848271.1 hypothetical protein [Kiritimatiellia bacterium]